MFTRKTIFALVLIVFALSAFAQSNLTDSEKEAIKQINVDENNNVVNNENTEVEVKAAKKSCCPHSKEAGCTEAQKAKCLEDNKGNECVHTVDSAGKVTCSHGGNAACSKIANTETKSVKVDENNVPIGNKTTCGVPKTHKCSAATKAKHSCGGH